MGLTYKIYYETSLLEDIRNLRENVSKEEFIKLIKLFKNKELLIKEFPRIYPRLQLESLNGEYRKIVLNQYIIIYKIVSNQIRFLKIYPQKTNYINKIKKLKKYY